MNSFWLPTTRSVIQEVTKETDRLHAALCAAGYNIRWLLRLIGVIRSPVTARWLNRSWIVIAGWHPGNAWVVV